MGFPVFISWSGQVSQDFATLLGEWIPDVLQAAEPFVSSTDIGAGSRWPNVLNENLQNSGFGVLCLTKDNIEAPWILFEAGSISKMFGSAALVPLLIGLKRTDIKFPLAQFQSISTERSELVRLFKSIRERGAIELSDERMMRLFDLTYADKSKRISEIEAASAKVSHQPRKKVDEADLQSAMDQILENIQSLHVILSSPENLLPRKYVEAIFARGQDSPRNASSPNESDPNWFVLSKLFDDMRRLASSALSAGLSDEKLNELYVCIEEAHKRFSMLNDRAAAKGGSLVDGSDLLNAYRAAWKTRNKNL